MKINFVDNEESYFEELTILLSDIEDYFFENDVVENHELQTYENSLRIRTRMLISKKPKLIDLSEEIPDFIFELKNYFDYLSRQEFKYFRKNKFDEIERKLQLRLFTLVTHTRRMITKYKVTYTGKHSEWFTLSNDS